MKKGNDYIIQLGFLDKGTGKHQSNIVVAAEGLSPTVVANWGIKQPSLMIVIRQTND